MEERMIDDEYGRGVRLKKTKDGYVDVTDELAADGTDETEELADEISFAFPMTDEDDEDLVGLSPEEALALRQKKAADAAKRQADYEAACKQGEELLVQGNFVEAEKTFERALNLDEIAAVASAGYWRAKTENFAKPDVLAEEYAKTGIENLEYDLGYEATDILRRDYREVFQKRHDELAEEEKPLAQEVEGKQQKRRKVLLSRLLKSGIGTAAFLLVTVVMAILAWKSFSDRVTVPHGQRTGFIVKACVYAGVAAVNFIVLLLFTNKLYNALRMHLRNEKLSSTESGKRLVIVRRYKALYASLLEIETVEEETDESANESADKE
ncbi:MAG: hypothetical protein IJY21_03610 [Clostridia bacterium]|nr:hypothetical protein [Clostridia bacterium]